jgi:putative MFS transporter
MASGIAAAGEYQIAARIERLPLSRWHVRIGLVVCTGFFFDAFDAMTLSYALPVLAPQWHLAPGAIGAAISIGFVGQLGGALFFGWLAERIGRVPCALYSLLIFTVMSLACAFAWNLPSLMAMRFIQGLGLGGEIPILATYINEFANAQRRGRFALSYQCAFAIGLPATAWVGAWVVPSFGWQWMFIIGAVPGLMAVPLARIMPESPRWLANRGRFAEADRVLARIEAAISRDGARPLPPIRAGVPLVQHAQASVGDLFRGIYRKRTLTVWALWFCTYVITYAFLTWLPTVWRTVYHLSLQQALNYGAIFGAVAAPGFILTILLIDFLGRRRMFLLGLLSATVLLLFLGLTPRHDAFTLLITLSLTQISVGMLALALSTYTAELYPTEMRALGGGFGSAWLRLGATTGPAMIGIMLPLLGLQSVFLAFGLLTLAGAVVCFFFAVEARGKVLEQLSPSLVRPRRTLPAAAMPGAEPT